MKLGFLHRFFLDRNSIWQNCVIVRIKHITIHTYHYEVTTNRNTTKDWQRNHHSCVFAWRCTKMLWQRKTSTNNDEPTQWMNSSKSNNNMHRYSYPIVGLKWSTALYYSQWFQHKTVGVKYKPKTCDFCVFFTLPLFIIIKKRTKEQKTPTATD